jgi:hypothetical protein
VRHRCADLLSACAIAKHAQVLDSLRHVAGAQLPHSVWLCNWLHHRGI